MKDNNALFTYNNLNFWRKFYLNFVWILTSFLWIGLIVILPKISILTILLVIAITLLSCWKHYAIVNRDIPKLKKISIVSIVLFLNIIDLFVFLSIIKISKKEIQEQIKNKV
jgi:hypothetical protein